MNLVGWFLAFVGLAAVVFGFLQMRKGGKLASVPFKSPSEIAKGGAAAGDSNGLVSTEGSVAPGPHMLVAPMSGRPCLAYEITVERAWEKSEQTQDGVKNKTGNENVFSERRGAIVPLRDAGGEVRIDFSGSLDADQEKSHESKVKVGAMIPGTLDFGQLQMNTPVIQSKDSRTVAFVGKEKIVAPSATLFALGALSVDDAGPVVRTPKGIAASLIVSSKGREALVGSTNKKMKLGYSIGGALAVAGSLLGVFGPKAESNACPSDLATMKAPTCEGRVSVTSGESYKLHVSEAAVYSVSATPAAVKNPLSASISVNDSSGKEIVAEEEHESGKTATVTKRLAAGDYTVTVKDSYESIVKGGFSFTLGVSKAPDASSAPIAVAMNDAPAKSNELPAAALAKGPAKVAVKAPTALAAKAAPAASAAAAPATPPSPKAPTPAAKPTAAAAPSAAPIAAPVAAPAAQPAIAAPKASAAPAPAKPAAPATAAPKASAAPAK